MYAGMVLLEDTLTGVLLVTNTSDTPVDADALPWFRIYGPDGYLIGGTCSLLHSGTITDATNASPIVVTTSTPHNLATGMRVVQSGVLGNTSANGTFTITKTGSNTYSLDSTSGGGAYTGGGTFHVVGAYAFSILCQGSDGFESGQTFDALFGYTISSVAKGQHYTFSVA